MGLFGFGKKKDKGNEVDQVFKNFGAGTNEVKTPAQQTRKQQQAAADAMRTSEVKKDQLLEKLGELRKFMYTNPDFDEYMTRVEDAIGKLKRMPDNQDKLAMSAVDNFMLQAIGDGINYCNRGSWVGMSACLDIVEELINDRFTCGAWYKDPKYCECRLTENKIYVEIKNLEAQLNTINTTGRKLKEKYADPRFATQQASIANEMMSLKEKKEMINQRIAELSKKKGLMQKMMNEIEKQVSTRVEQEHFDVQDNFDDIMMAKAENDANVSAIDKMSDRLSQSKVKLSDSSLSIDGGMLEEDEQKAAPIDLNDFDF